MKGEPLCVMQMKGWGGGWDSTSLTPLFSFRFYRKLSSRLSPAPVGQTRLFFVNLVSSKPERKRGPLTEAALRHLPICLAAGSRGLICPNLEVIVPTITPRNMPLQKGGTLCLISQISEVNNNIKGLCCLEREKIEHTYVRA